ncbi:ABC transporter ATP-binding protein [Pelagibius litoralis]|uniref:Spermidine/putrescine import ATP-binding protein PotA n=2 Tax=Pelagibius litoralis TaxID=374515 RepID=A0A967F1I1_9PROT|nr:ABC transporter ATP-binding protein [Pelagibius litoralis]
MTTRDRPREADSSDPQIKFSHIVKEYPTDDGGTFRALDDVSLDVGANEFFTLLGPSGCGKTTLLRILAGFETPNEGRVTLDGTDITSDPANKRPVNTVFQSYALFPHMTIKDNVGFGLRMLGRPRSEYDATALEILELVRLPQMAARKPSQLSGGQQQRIALARALAPHPRVLLLDEPLSALDLKLRKEMQIEMKRIQQESHTTFVFVTHDQEEALTMSDRIAVMDHGTLQQVGTPQQIYNRPVNRFVAGFIGEMNFIETVGTPMANGSALVFDTPLGQMHAPKEATVPPHAAILAIRPERFRLHDGSGPDKNVINAVVENVIFTGPFASVHIRCGERPQELRVRLSAAENDLADVVVGGSIKLEMPTEHLRMLAP